MRHALRSLAGAALLTARICRPALAEGTFDIPAGAHFNPQKLERIGEFFRSEIADGKIPGAIVLIRSMASRSISKNSACATSPPNCR